MPGDDGHGPPVLVTGASGFAGGHLALRLRGLGHPVRALVRPGAYVRRLRAAGVTLIEGDLRNRQDVLRAAAGVARIFHLGAVFRAAAPPESYYREVNVGGTEHILEAARNHGVERTIHCSTIAVHGAICELPCDEASPFNPRDVYQQTKLDGELKARAAIKRGLPVVIARPAGIYGPGDLRFLKLFQAIYLRRFRMFGSGETLWQGIYIDDLIDGLLLCAEHPNALGQTYILAEERPFTLNHVVEAIANAVGAPAPKARLPHWPLAAGAALCEALCRPFGLAPPLPRRRAAFFVEHRAFSIRKAQHELGYAPKVPLEEGLGRTANWYLAHGYLPPRGT
jgi:nucleoside-diphosphate-sugar epimerase